VIQQVIKIGFDLQVRQVEYKDKMEEEWEMFQRAMKEESHVSSLLFLKTFTKSFMN
jgi:hypothetical protein